MPVQNVKGLATGSWTRVITIPSEQKADVSYTLYNSKYQPLRTYTTNYLSGYIQTDNVLTFRGIPTKTITTQKKDTAATALIVTNNYTYDHRERLKTHTQQINGGTATLIAENTYDELGMLITKKVGNTTAVPLQKVDYKYNLRGWLTDINNTQLDTENDLFNFRINYNQSGGRINNKVLYNGNINSMLIRTKTDNVLRGYSYYYDDLNRLTQAKNLYYESGGWNIGVNDDDSYEEALSYDKNGNILTLNRSGELISGQPVEIDDLTYTYTANQLQSVTDATNNPAGFNDGNTIGADYTYDAFGNLKADKNKGITGIKYNHLNLPTEITFANGKIDYTYDATGTKVKKVVQPNSGVAQTTDYLYGFQYLNGQLQFFPHAEGYVKPNGTNSYLYVYQYKDHLGNVRLSYADCDGNGTINPATEILEENNYYPFGLQHQGYNDIANSCRNEEAEAYKLNGKEYEDSFGLNIYEMDLRQLDPAIGRWVVQDPVTHHDYSPYSAFDNNPVYWSDPSGADADIYKLNGRLVGASFTEQEAIDAFLALVDDSSKTVEVAVENTYEFSTTPGDTGGGGGDGNGNGGGDPKKSIWTTLAKSIIFGNPGNVKYDGDAYFGTNFIGPGPDVDPRTLGLQPKDMLDLAAFFHDISYFNAKTGGVDGALNNLEVLGADKKLASDAYKIVVGYWQGKTDPVTQMKISQRTYNMAQAVYGAFGPISEFKSIQVNTKMFFNTYRQTILNNIMNNIRY